MTKNNTNTFHISWARHLLNCLNFGSVNFNASFRTFISKNNSFINHKVEFLPIKNKISFLTSLQNFNKVVQTIIKRSSIDGEIVHEHLHNFFTKTMKNSRHASLKSSRSITQTKRHASISISTVGTSKSYFLLIFLSHSNLRETRITIKKTKVSLLSQPL